MNDIMKIVRSLEKSGLLIKGISKTFKNEAKQQKGGFPGMLLGTLDIFRYPLAGKGAIATSQRQDAIRACEVTLRAGEGRIRAGQDFNATSSFNQFCNTKVLSKWT